MCVRCLGLSLVFGAMVGLPRASDSVGSMFPNVVAIYVVESEGRFWERVGAYIDGLLASGRASILHPLRAPTVHPLPVSDRTARRVIPGD